MLENKSKSAEVGSSRGGRLNEKEAVLGRGEDITAALVLHEYFDKEGYLCCEFTYHRYKF